MDIEFPGTNGWDASQGQCTVTNSMDQRHRTVRCLNNKDPDVISELRSKPRYYTERLKTNIAS